jgi:hypothetical protein
VIVRAYNPKTDDISNLEHHAIDLNRDFVVVVEDQARSANRIIGLLSWRLIGYADQLSVEKGNPLARRIVEKVVDYARGTGRGMNIKECMFVTDRSNEAFRKYMQENGADPQHPEEVFYQLEVR